jgi:TolA-binding protein
MMNIPTTTETPCKEKIWEGIQLVRESKVKEGMQILHKVALEFPNCNVADDAFYYMGLVFLNYSKKAKAYSCFYKIVHEYPNSNVFRYAKLRLQELENERDPAYELFYKVEYSFREKKYDEALKLIKTIQSKFPDSVLVDNAYLYEALIYQNLYRIENKPDYSHKAEELFDFILQKFPDSDAAEFVRKREHLALTELGLRPQSL